MIVKPKTKTYFYDTTGQKRPVRFNGTHAAVVDKGLTHTLILMDSGHMEQVANDCIEQVSDTAAVLRQQWWNTSQLLYEDELDQADQYAWFIKDYNKRITNSGKTCNQCSQFKPLGNFGKREASADGLQPICKECVAENNAIRYRQRHN